jgi:hypothetical protein
MALCLRGDGIQPRHLAFAFFVSITKQDDPDKSPSEIEDELTTQKQEERRMRRRCPQALRNHP